MYQSPDAGLIRKEEPLSSLEEEFLNNSKQRESYKSADPKESGLVYTKEDQDYVTERENEFGPPTERSILWDRIMFFNSNWFGNTKITRTSRFDDIRNGVDLLVEFYDEENNVIGELALDTTIGSLDTLRDKFSKIFGNSEHEGKLQRGKLADLKYKPVAKKDKTAKTEFARTENIPQVILDISAKTLKDYVTEEVNELRLRHTILDEALGQLDVQKEFILEQKYHHSIKEKLTAKIDKVVELLLKEKSSLPIAERIDDNIAQHATEPALIRSLSNLEAKA